MKTWRPGLPRAALRSRARHHLSMLSSLRLTRSRCFPSCHAKGALYTWLAWQAQPDRPFDTALTARVLRHDSPQAQRFVAWLHQRFPAGPPGASGLAGG